MVSGLISKIQRYSIKDGPGLRSTVFLIGCNLRCRWCSNPELMLYGCKIFYFSERCRKCGTCVAIAADHSITLTSQGCQIDRILCVNLSDCAEACPYDAYERVGTRMQPEELVQKLLRDKIFFENSGGGVTFFGWRTSSTSSLRAEMYLDATE